MLLRKACRLGKRLFFDLTTILSFRHHKNDNYCRYEDCPLHDRVAHYILWTQQMHATLTSSTRPISSPRLMPPPSSTTHSKLWRLPVRIPSQPRSIAWDFFRASFALLHAKSMRNSRSWGTCDLLLYTKALASLPPCIRKASPLRSRQDAVPE